MATTHPDAKERLQALGIETVDLPLVCKENIATAGGCLSAVYLVGWIVERLYNIEKRRETLKPIIPTGQKDFFEKLITSSIQEGVNIAYKHNIKEISEFNS